MGKVILPTKVPRHVFWFSANLSSDGFVILRLFFFLMLIKIDLHLLHAASDVLRINEHTLLLYKNNIYFLIN